MTAGAYVAAITGFISGLLLDCFATQLGINALNLLIFGYVTGLCARQIFFDNLWSQSLCIFILTLMSKMLLFSLTIIHARSAVILPLDLYLTQHWYFLPSALLNVVLAIPIFHFLKRPYAIRNYDEQVELDEWSVKSGRLLLHCQISSGSRSSKTSENPNFCKFGYNQNKFYSVLKLMTKNEKYRQDLYNKDNFLLQTDYCFSYHGEHQFFVVMVQSGVLTDLEVRWKPKSGGTDSFASSSFSTAARINYG